MKSIFIALLLMPFCIAQAGQTHLQFNEPWIQQGPPNSRVLAGFMNINNTTDKPVTITAIHGKAFKRVEIHQTVHENGMARMHQQESLTIEPGKSIKLEHGGYHLMLIKPLRKLTSGEEVTLTFTFHSGKTQTVVFTVKQPADQGHEHHHHH